MLWEVLRPAGNRGEEENSKERLSPSLERRRALDFLFAAICLVLLREINSPRHTDQYSLNPHLIWREFPPISPSLLPSPRRLSFPLSSRFQPFFMLLVRACDTEGNDVSWREQRMCACVYVCVCVRVGSDGYDVLAGRRSCRQGPPDAGEID